MLKKCMYAVLVAVASLVPLVTARMTSSNPADVLAGGLQVDAGEEDSNLMFDAWLDMHAKAYVDPNEYLNRKLVFEENAETIQRHNRAFQEGLTQYAMTIHGPFSDWTDTDFKESYLMESQNCSATTHKSSGLLPIDESQGGSLNIPKHVDWRTQGIVTPIKNQGHCGSCWTFSTTGCLEAHYCLGAKKRKEALGERFDCTQWTGLAEQQLLDCAHAYNNNGCNGGLPSQAFEYIHYAGGLELETAYAYEANETGSCQTRNTLKNKGVQVAQVFNITSGVEDDLIRAVAEIGPVSIAYQVSPDFRFYKHGIYDSFNTTTNETMCHSSPQDVNHAVVAVGLGWTEASERSESSPYYIVRNSWGTGWGMEGYFWMKRGENLCGVSDCASFPIVPEYEDEEKLEETQGLLRSGHGKTVTELAR
jgi:cathepsin H